MSPIGKIFILLNFVLAGAFLGWASVSLAKGDEWKTKYEAEAQAKTDLEATLTADKSKLQVELNNEKAAKEALRAELDAKSAENLRNKEDLDAERRKNEQLSADVAGIKETLAGYNQTISAMESAKDAAVADARQFERERDASQKESSDALMAQRSAEEALAKANNDIADLEKGLKSTRDQLAALEARYKTLIAKAPGLDPGGATAAIDARVLKVDYSIKPGLLALNAGSKQGVEKGMTFEIFDGVTYKGQARVENVREDMCSALITLSMPNTTMGQGDSAATIF
jgi:hypothetical protein